jgi:site-specific recombinase XerD
LKIPVILTRKELMRLIAVPVGDIETASNRHQLFNSIRNEAILQLLCSTGLRIQELANLNRSNIFPQEQRIKIRQGKKGNEDYVPVASDATWRSLERYGKARETIPGTGEAYFVGWNGQRILPRQFNRHLKDYGSRAGIKKNVHAHILRHSFGTLFYKATQDLVKTQLALRHRDISSTMIYVHIEKKAVIEGLRLAGL